MPPVLYSFRRCPYAMRARLTIKYSGCKVELREVLLRDMPASLLEISPKGTVPVLLTDNQEVIEESLDIMHWALAQNDPDNWLTLENRDVGSQLIEKNDSEFKYWLDRYKYADRFPEDSQQSYRSRCEAFLTELESALSAHQYLTGDELSFADTAIFPFIRQFAFVDKAWFDQTQYSQLQNWLQQRLESRLFDAIMEKHLAWQSGDQACVLL
ncbi:MAG: glutathione S-transferase [Gammaproteobacteria bacterium]